jgi:hypothetical protein
MIIFQVLHFRNPPEDPLSMVDVQLLCLTTGGHSKEYDISDIIMI